MSFTHFLPLIIGDLIPLENPDWQLLLSLLIIIDLISKSEYSSEDLNELSNAVQKHHIAYIELYGALKPKHHFLVHYASIIKRSGPIKHLWCMRFESKLREAKLYTHNMNSRVNPAYSIAIRSGLKFSSRFLENLFFFKKVLKQF